jgi:CubicO group peptidase (beta-lactamase class C family)
MLALCSVLMLLPGADTAPSENESVNQVLAIVQRETEVPGIVAAIVRGDQLAGIAAVGVRKFGDPTPITTADLMHLGSNTKAMTATMIATVIEEGKLDWDTSLAKIFPREAEAWHPDWRSVTLHQLLTHTASMPRDISVPKEAGNTTTEQRRAILTQDWLKYPPETKPGTCFRYSNAGYLFAGLVAETVTGKSWETLMRERVFDPLCMKHTGFGVPGTPGKTDQPWGHSVLLGLRIHLQKDNPPWMGPAGTVHAPVADWSKFVVQHLQGERSETKTKLLLKPETFRKLHAPEKEQYACGWVRMPGEGLKVPYLWHNGSIGSWYAEMRLDPENNVAVLVATNQFDDSAQQAVRVAGRELLRIARNKPERKKE